MAHKNEEGRNKPLYMISVAAELTGMHPQTLRVYEQKGLVNPGRSRGNTRLSSQADIERLELIGRLTAEGITALAPYEGMTPENVIRGRLGGKVEGEQDQ